MKKSARQVISQGKPLVNLTKPAESRSRTLPDFGLAARADRAGAKVGDRLLKRLLADEALS